MVKTESPFPFYIRILTVSILIALLGLGPAPHAVGKLLVSANRFLASNDPLNAANSLAQVANYYPWRVDFNITAAQYAFQAGDPKATIQYFERPGTITQLTPQNLIMLGDAYNQSGNQAVAEAIWKHVIDLGDPLPAYQRLADLYLEKKDYSTAASYLQQQFIVDPTNIQLPYRIGVLYALTDPTKALPFLAQAMEIDPADAAQAKTLHDKIRTANLFDEPAYTLLIIGRQLAEWGEWAYAGVTFQKAVTLRPSYADAWAFLGEAKQQEFIQETGAISDLGLPELEHAIQLENNSIIANTLMGLYWERQEDYSKAQQYLEHAIGVNPSDSYLYTELGNIFSKAGDLPAAQATYEKAITLSPSDPLFYRLLAQFAMENQIQVRELALPAARQAITLAPNDASSLDVMAQVMLMLLDYQSAERYSKRALQSDPQYAPAYLHLGTAYLYQGQSTLARLWLGQAVSVDPDSWVAAQATRLLDYYFPK